MASADDEVRDKAMRRYARLRGRSSPAAGGLRRRVRGGLASRPASACPTGCSPSRSAPCPAASAAGSSWPGSCSPAPTTLLLDEPTNHLDADSIVWLREFLRSAQGRPGRDQPRRRACSRRPSTRSSHLDANRGRARRLQHGLEGVPAAARDRRAAPPRERANAEKKAGALHGAGRPDARQGHQGRGRAEHGPAGRAAAVRARARSAGADKVATAALPRRRPRAARPR